MEYKFKPKFWKDILKLKNDKLVMSALDKIFTNVENAETPHDINNIKQLERFEARFRIKLFIDKKRDFRIGVYIHKKNCLVCKDIAQKENIRRKLVTTPI